MRKLATTLLTLLLLALPAVGYVAYPLYTAWAIREAVRAGDSAYLNRKIEWARVRETLRASMTQVAFDMPDPEAEPGVKPSLWKRIKAYVGGGAVNKLIDRYVTPEGLPQLFEYRKMYRENISHEVDERTLPFKTRIANFWSRLKRAEFKSLTAFEVELADKYEPKRRHIGLLELQGTEWKLAELRVKEVDPALDPVSAPTKEAGPEAAPSRIIDIEPESADVSLRASEPNQMGAPLLGAVPESADASTILPTDR